MDEKYREQIYNNLAAKETEELLEIWQAGDASEWHPQVFEIIKKILFERLGHVPPLSIETQVLRILEEVEQHLENNELDKAFGACETAIQMDPNFADAYNYRGEIYEEMGQPENAISDYQRAIQLAPDFEDAWENMLGVEPEIEDQFEESVAKHHLDQALEYAYDEEPEKALQECELAKPALPGIAIAYNYLGLILQTLNQLEPALEAYLKAMELNPRFYAARENLANARVILEEEQYLQVTNLDPSEIQEVDEMNTETGEFLDSEVWEGDNPVPGWSYLDANAFLLSGWPGHRTRPGRSGYDPLETDFELAHMQGLVFRLLITRRFRTRNPAFLLLMTFMGLVYSLPLLGVLEVLTGNLNYLALIIVYSPYLIVGLAFLVNVALSLALERYSEEDDNGYTFF